MFDVIAEFHVMDHKVSVYRIRNCLHRRLWKQLSHLQHVTVNHTAVPADVRWTVAATEVLGVLLILSTGGRATRCDVFSQTRWFSGVHFTRRWLPWEITAKTNVDGLQMQAVPPPSDHSRRALITSHRQIYEILITWLNGGRSSQRLEWALPSDGRR